MKCFSLIFFFLFNHSIAAQVHLYAISKDQVSFGDIVLFRVENFQEDLKKYKNRRISERLIMLDVDRNELKAVIAPEDKNEKEQIKDQFIIHDLNFKFKKIDLKGDVSFIDQKIILKKYQWGLYVIIILSFSIILFFLRRYLRRKKIIESRKRKREKLGLLKSDPKREDLEYIYSNKALVQNLYKYDRDKLEGFFLLLNNIQYKKIWSEEEKKNVLDAYKKFILSLEENDGV